MCPKRSNRSFLLDTLLYPLPRGTALLERMARRGSLSIPTVDSPQQHPVPVCLLDLDDRMLDPQQRRRQEDGGNNDRNCVR